MAILVLLWFGDSLIAASSLCRLQYFRTVPDSRRCGIFVWSLPYALINGRPAGDGNSSRRLLGTAFPGSPVIGRMVARQVILAQRAIPSYGPLWLHHYRHNPPFESRAEAACVAFSKAVVQIFGQFAVMPNGSHTMI